eukprot:4084103-Prymnesium_polylepis.1
MAGSGAGTKGLKERSLLSVGRGARGVAAGGRAAGRYCGRMCGRTQGPRRGDVREVDSGGAARCSTVLCVVHPSCP